jgi:DNA-directed RNA polymerase specialized sigma24 family protein
MLKPRASLREFLNTPESLSYINYNISKRGFIGDSDTLSELQGAVVESLLSNEYYYEEEFEYSLKTYINLVITQVIDRYKRKPDAFNGELVSLDANCGDEEGMTYHDVIGDDDSLTNTSRVFTERGMPELLTYYMTKLPEQQADVFVMKAVFGYSHEEVSDILDISVAYSKQLYLEAKRELRFFRESEQAYEAQLEIGNVSGRIISNNASDAGVWADWSWNDNHAEPGPVHIYSKPDIQEYCEQRGINY